MQTHEFYMRRAIALAGNVPHLPFGAVIVDRASGDIVAEGWNRGETSAVLHGEIDALLKLPKRPRGQNTNAYALYTTAEPCPMCQSAMHWVGISEVYFGTSIPSLVRFGFWQIPIRAVEIAAQTTFFSCRVVGGILEAECDALFEHAGLLRV